MSQHYLLSSKSRTLKLKEIFKLSDKKAFDIFKNIRWKEGKPVCPNCKSVNKYWLLASKQFKCKACKKKFSLTSGTIFQDRKLSLQDYLGAIAIMTNASKGYSMVQLSRDLGVQYKTAFVLAHKIRESLMNHRNLSLMEGEIEIDATYIGGKVKEENIKDNRIDRRLKEFLSPNKRAIIVLKQRCNNGLSRTLTFVRNSENQKDVNSIVENYVSKQSTVYADESNAYDLLHAKYTMKRVNHSVEYANIKINANINQAESFFSRLKRAYVGQHHHFGTDYLAYYVNEMAYREDMRRVDNKNVFNDTLYKALNSGLSLRLRGYWKRSKRK